MWGFMKLRGDGPYDFPTTLYVTGEAPKGKSSKMQMIGVCSWVPDCGTKGLGKLYYHSNFIVSLKKENTCILLISPLEA